MISSGGPRNTAAGTLTQLYFDALGRYDKPDALQVKERGVYQPISSRTVGYGKHGSHETGSDKGSSDPQISFLPS